MVPGSNTTDSERSSTSRFTYTVFGGPSPQKDATEGKLKEDEEAMIQARADEGFPHHSSQTKLPLVPH